MSASQSAGPSEPRYLAFLETLAQLRPRLHRYCARMTGSVLDGEDVAQEALFQAFRKLDTYDETRPLTPWLFRIAHNRCIDLLRQRGVREHAELEGEDVAESDASPGESDGAVAAAAVERLVLLLPPKERACVLLKDVFDHSLEDIAELVDSTVGGVKAALHRGRSKLAQQQTARAPKRERSDDELVLLQLYVERFNRRDWDGLRELISDDAQLRLTDRFSGPLDRAPYFGTYERMAGTWQLALGEVDGDTAILIMRPGAAGWVPHAMVDLRLSGGTIVEITDHWFCPWVIQAAESVRVGH